MIQSLLLAWSPFLLGSLVSVQTQDQVLDLPSTLERVTVYPGQALAERVVEVSVEKTGPLTISVGPLPLSAQASSFQTSVMEGQVVVQGLELRRRSGSPKDWAEADALRSQLEDLQWEKRLLEGDAKGIQAAIDGLKAIIESQKTDPTVAGLLPADLGERLESIRKEMAQLDREAATKEKELHGYALQISDLEKQLNPLTTGAQRDFREVRLSLFVERVGTVRLRLSYLAVGAWWEPAYDVRVAPDLTGVNVGLVGQVTQRTGEDWRDVELLLSTSMPSLGLDPPKLPGRHFRVGRRRGQVKDQALAPLGYASEDEPLTEKELVAAPEVSVRDFGITTQFLLPGKSTVRANGEAHRFRIRELPLEVRPERYVVPSLSDKAYLRAKVTHTGEAPLLPGTAKVFLGPDYLGEASFPILRQGDSTLLNLGIDPHLTVDWETLEDKRTNPGHFSLSSTAHISRRYRATFHLSASARGQISVLVEEVLPISWDDRIEVEIEGLQPNPLEGADDLIAREEKGIYRWRFLVAPGSTHSIRWGYDLSFDEDLRPELREE